MLDSRMLGIPNRPEKPVVEIDLPLGWSARSVAPRRVVDVGYPMLTYVTVLSITEAARINEQYKQKATQRLRAKLAEYGEGYIGQNIDENAVQGGAEVDKLLAAIKEEGYFWSWVIIEECTIDCCR